MPDHGFKLVFDKRSQRLRCIEVCDPSRLRLRCGPGAVFGGAAHPPTYSGLYSAFGPTLESDIDLSTGLQPLLYPGLVALFEPDCAAGNGRSSADKFIPPTGPATSIYIFSGSATSVAGALASSPPLRLGAGASPVAEVVLGKGAWFAGGRCTVRLGDAAQEIVAELGEPDAVHHKPLLNKTEVSHSSLIARPIPPCPLCILLH